MPGRLSRVVKRASALIGWREYVGLPDLHIPVIKAKIDTGARTTALHAMVEGVRLQEGVKWLDFRVFHGKKAGELSSHPLLDQRDIKNTSGVPETRYVIKTRLRVGARSWPIEISLADRERMAFDIILGRTAIRGRSLLVDPGKSFLAGQPT